MSYDLAAANEVAFYALSETARLLSIAIAEKRTISIDVGESPTTDGWEIHIVGQARPKP